MIKRIIVLLLVGWGMAPSADAQNLKKLHDNNGFKNHKLGTRYTSLYGVKAKQEDGSEKVVVNTPEQIGNIPVASIELVYLADTLSRIIVNVETNYHESLLNACVQSFGPFTKNLSDNEKTRAQTTPDSTGHGIASSRERNFTDAYLWEAQGIRLAYEYTYPKLSGDHYAVNRLRLIYSIGNFEARYHRVRKKFSANDF